MDITKYLILRDLANKLPKGAPGPIEPALGARLEGPVLNGARTLNERLAEIASPDRTQSQRDTYQSTADYDPVLRAHKESIPAPRARCASLVPLVFLALIPADLAAQPMLDFSTETPGATTSAAIPGWSGATLLVPLTLEVTIQDLFPLAATEPGRVTALILIRNKAKTPVQIPASRDQGGILRPGIPGKKELHLGLVIAPAGMGKSFYFSMASAIGAPSVPGSMVELAPGESIVIRSVCKSFLTLDAGEPTTSIGEADVKVVVSEDLLEDDGYVIRNHSEKIVSNNSIRVYWPFQIRQRGSPTSQK